MAKEYIHYDGLSRKIEVNQVVCVNDSTKRKVALGVVCKVNAKKIRVQHFSPNGQLAFDANKDPENLIITSYTVDEARQLTLDHWEALRKKWSEDTK